LLLQIKKFQGMKAKQIRSVILPSHSLIFLKLLIIFLQKTSVADYFGRNHGQT